MKKAYLKFYVLEIHDISRILRLIHQQIVDLIVSFTK